MGISVDPSLISKYLKEISLTATAGSDIYVVKADTIVIVVGGQVNHVTGTTTTISIRKTGYEAVADIDAYIADIGTDFATAAYSAFEWAFQYTAVAGTIGQVAAQLPNPVIAVNKQSIVIVGDATATCKLQLLEIPISKKVS